MKVSELIRTLQQFNGDLPVEFRAVGEFADTCKGCGHPVTVGGVFPGKADADVKQHGDAVRIVVLFQ